MSQKIITVGTPSAKASIDTNFGNAQDNFTELYRSTKTAPAIIGTPASDTAAINAALLNGNCHVLITQDVTIDAPLIIYSNTHLELAPGVTVTFPATTGPMLYNRSAFSHQRAITNAVMTAGDKTLTSANAAFTSADVGRSVIVTDAGAGGKYSVAPFTAVGGPLCADIVSVTSATEVELEFPAQASVSGVLASIYDRDQNIKISGGHFVFTGVGNPEDGITRGIGNSRMMLFLRRVDGLIIENVGLSSTINAKYAINLGDVRHARINNITFNSAADGLHIRGPAIDIKARNLTGYTDDDFTAITATDNIVYTDVQGDVVDVVFENINGSTGENHFKLTANTGTQAKNIVARGYTDLSGAVLKATVYDDPLCGTGVGTKTYGLLLENWVSDKIGIGLSSTGGGSVLLKNIRKMAKKTITETAWENSFYFGIGSVWGDVTIDGYWDTTSSYRYNGATISGTVGKFTIRNAEVTTLSTDTESRLLSIYGSIGSLHLDNISKTYGGIINQRAGSTVSRTYLTNIFSDNLARLYDVASNANVIMHGLQVVNFVNPSFYISGASLTLNGSGFNGIKTSGQIQRAASEAVNVCYPDLPGSLAHATKFNGGMMYNSNSSLSCGAGPVASDGSVWKHLITDATY